MKDHPIMLNHRAISGPRGDPRQRLVLLYYDPDADNTSEFLWLRKQVHSETHECKDGSAHARMQVSLQRAKGV